ncbi:hypothetical protein ACTA71_007007 [Dictyostelium dimigraforme]
MVMIKLIFQSPTGYYSRYSLQIIHALKLILVLVHIQTFCTLDSPNPSAAVTTIIDYIGTIFLHNRILNSNKLIDATSGPSTTHSCRIICPSTTRAASSDPSTINAASSDPSNTWFIDEEPCYWNQLLLMVWQIIHQQPKSQIFVAIKIFWITCTKLSRFLNWQQVKTIQIYQLEARISNYNNKILKWIIQLKFCILILDACIKW